MTIFVDGSGMFPRVGEKKEDGIRDIPRRMATSMIVEVIGQAQGKLSADLKKELFRRLYPSMSKDIHQLCQIWDEPRWMSNDLRDIPVSQMETQHLIHSLNKIARKDNWRTDWIPVLGKELDKRLKKHFKYEGMTIWQVLEVGLKDMERMEHGLEHIAPLIGAPRPEPMYIPSGSTPAIERLLKEGFKPKWEDDPWKA